MLCWKIKYDDDDDNRLSNIEYIYSYKMQTKQSEDNNRLIITTTTTTGAAATTTTT